MSNYAGVSTLGAKTAIDRPATGLDELCHKLDLLANEFGEIYTRLEQCNNRAAGPSPDAVGKTAPTPEPQGMLGLLSIKADRLAELAAALRSEASRLERVL